MPMGRHGHQHDGSPLCTFLPISKRRMLFIAHVLPMCCVACYVLACLPCDASLFAMFC